MNINIEFTRDNSVLSRKEIKAVMTFSGPTPPRHEVRNAVADAAGSKPECVAIHSVNSEYGAQQASIEAHIYKSAEALRECEPKHIIKRCEKSVEKSKPKKEEKPAEAKPEEKPAEEVKKEPKEKAKPEEKKEEAPAEEKKEEPAKAPAEEPKKEGD